MSQITRGYFFYCDGMNTPDAGQIAGAIAIAYVVHLHRKIIVARHEFAWEEFEDQRLQIGERAVEADNRRVVPGHMRRVFNQLAQAVTSGAA